MVRMVLLHLETKKVTCDIKIVTNRLSSMIIFAVCSPRINGVIDPARLPDKVSDLMSSLFISPGSVLKLIKQLKRNSSGGPDSIPAEFYMETGHLIAFPLSMIFNMSL